MGREFNLVVTLQLYHDSLQRPLGAAMDGSDLAAGRGSVTNFGTLLVGEQDLALLDLIGDSNGHRGLHADIIRP